MPRVILPHPENSTEEIRVKYRVVMPPDFAGADDEERADLWFDDEFSAEIEVVVLNIEERGKEGEWEDRSVQWALSALLDEIEETVRDAEVSRSREKYVDRLVKF
jgi:hypothetical protein